MKIMLVDDDRTMRAMLKVLLEMEHHQITTWNGQPESDIYSQICAERPDVLLLDVFLHEVSGMEILSRLRTDPDLRNIRVVMTSGMAMKEECLAAGADAFLLKPYMPDDLTNLLRQFAAEPHS